MHPETTCVDYGIYCSDAANLTAEELVELQNVPKPMD